jgi:hypothetical protein
MMRIGIVLVVAMLWIGWGLCSWFCHTAWGAEKVDPIVELREQASDLQRQVNGLQAQLIVITGILMKSDCDCNYEEVLMRLEALRMNMNSEKEH